MLAEMSGLSTFLLGLGILAVALVLRRSIGLSRRVQKQDVLGDVRETLRQREDSAVAAACKAEIRLHEVTRECEAAVSTRIALLEQLIRDADDRIQRLRNLLETDQTAGRPAPLRMHPGPEIVLSAEGASKRSSTPPRGQRDGALSSRDPNRTEREAYRLFIVHMAQAGFSPKEIAHFTDRPQNEVEAILQAAGLTNVTGPKPESDRAEAA